MVKHLRNEKLVAGVEGLVEVDENGMVVGEPSYAPRKDHSDCDISEIYSFPVETHPFSQYKEYKKYSTRLMRSYPETRNVFEEILSHS